MIDNDGPVANVNVVEIDSGGMGKTAMDKTSYNRILPSILMDKGLFPQRDKNMALKEKNVTMFFMVKKTIIFDSSLIYGVQTRHTN